MLFNFVKVTEVDSDEIDKSIEILKPAVIHKLYNLSLNSVN